MLELLKKFFKPFLALFIGAFVLTVGRVLCELMLPNLMSKIIDEGVVMGDMAIVLAMGGQMLIWAVLAAAVDIGGNACAARASMGFGREIRSAIYNRVSSFSLHELDEFGTSSLITRTTNDVQQLERFTQMCMGMAMMSPLMLIGAATMSLLMNWRLALVVFAAIPILLVMILFIGRFTMPLLRSLQARIDALNRVTREGLTGIRVIRAYNRQGYEEQRFAKANRDLAETNVSVARRMMAMMPLSSVVFDGVIILITWFGAQFIDMGTFQVGQMMAIIQYATHALFSAMMLSGLFIMWPRAVAAAERIQAVLNTEPEIVDAEHTVDIDLAVVRKPHRVTFDHVSYSFPGAENPALKDVDFEMEPGKTYALIGATGSGKTTLINLLERFLAPTEGRILIDGMDISQMRQEDLRSLISYVPQKTTLFTGTLAENIRYGNPDATDSEVREAARAAAALEFIESKEGGFDFKITQAGGGLSGGQKQRIAIARALASPCGLYVFDDSFSALDFKTDAQVRRSLSQVTSGATVLIIAQRIAAAMDADQVMVLDEGKLVGTGTHAELMQTCQVYREIVASQLDESEVK